MWLVRTPLRRYAGEQGVRWDLGRPHPSLVDRAGARELTGAGRRAIVVGCGLGEDAEFVAGLGFGTVAFDIAPSAVCAARSVSPTRPSTTSRRTCATVRPGGTLLVIASGVDDGVASFEGPPWPLTRAEVGLFAGAGLRQVRFDETPDAGGAGVHRWVVELRRPAAARRQHR